MSFGTPRSGGPRHKRKFEKLKDGSLAFRILPPIGHAEEQGVWSKFYRVHYGYKNSADQLRPFESSFIKNNKTKMIEVPDAALERIEKMQAMLEKAKEDGDTATISKLAKLVGNGKELGQYNLDSNHYLNAINTQGEIVVLKLRHKAMLALLAARKKMMEEEGVDPVAAEGRFLVFSRSGMGLETTFTVSPLQETVKIDGRNLKQDVVHVADEALYRRCVRTNADGSYSYVEAADLLALFPKPTAEEIAEIVKGGAEAVDRILGAPRAAGTSESAAPAANTAAATAEDIDLPEGDIGNEYAIPPATKTTVATASAAVEKQLATPAPKAAVIQPATKTAAAVSEMSDEDFLASLG